MALRSTITPSLESSAEEFASALVYSAGRYAVQLSDSIQTDLRRYYEYVLRWNPRLHLVAPCSPAEFAKRHILESLVALSFLPPQASVVDVGSGAGLPVVPCLIARPDLKAWLVEASGKKAVFLQEVLRQVTPNATWQVVNERFELAPAPPAEFVTCRALNRFAEMLPHLVNWATPSRTLLLFGGENLHHALTEMRLPFTVAHLPDSTQRFLFVVSQP